MSDLQLRPPDHDPIGGVEARVVGRITGLVKRLEFHLPQRHEPSLYHAHGDFGDVGRLMDGDGVEMSAAGEGVTQYGSSIRCIGEAVERYCARWPPEYHSYGTRTTTFGSLSASAEESVVSLEYLQVFDGPDRRSSDGPRRLGPDSKLRWAGATDLLTGEVRYVPVPLLRLLLEEPVDGYLEPVANSNGMACHHTQQEAVLNGLLELVERHAVLTHWYRQSPPARLTGVRALPEVATLIDERIGARSSAYRLLYYETDLDVHVVSCAFVNGDDEKPKFGLVGAAAIDLEDAIVDALLECAQLQVHSKRAMYHLDRPDLEQRDLTEHHGPLLYYMDPDNFEEVEPFLDGPVVDVEDLARRSRRDETAGERLRHVLDELETQGYTPLGVDVTTSDVREAGFHVASTYVPELVPLSVAAYPPLNHPAFADDEPVRKPHPLP